MIQVITTTDVRDIDETFVVKLRGLDIENQFFYTQLTLNGDDNNFDENFNDINYKRTVRKLQDYGCKNSYFTSADVSMLGYGCGVYHYPQFYDKFLDMYQVLPRLYRGYFEVFSGDKFVKMGVILGISRRNICLGMY